MSHFTFRVAEGVLPWRLVAVSYGSSLFFSLNKFQGPGSALFLSRNEKSSCRTNYSECISLGVTVQTEEKQVAVITAYRLKKEGLNTSEEVVWAVGRNYCIRIRCCAVSVLEWALGQK